jgi:hypothetical protein
MQFTKLPRTKSTALTACRGDFVSNLLGHLRFSGHLKGMFNCFPDHGPGLR